MALTAITVQVNHCVAGYSLEVLYLLAGAVSEPQCTSVAPLGLPAGELDMDTLCLRHQFHTAIYFKGQGLVFRKQGITGQSQCSG